MPVSSLSPSSAQEPLSTESFRGNFQRNGLREGFLFLKGCIKEGWVNTKSPEADQAGLPNWNPGALRCLSPPPQPAQDLRRGNAQGEGARTGREGITVGPCCSTLGVYSIPAVSGWSYQLPGACRGPGSVHSSQMLLYTELNPRDGFSYSPH